MKNFDELLKKKDIAATKKTVAVVWPNEPVILQAACDAQKQHGVAPLLVGDADAIRRLLNEMGIGENVEIIHAESPEQAIQKSIALVREGKADILQKGLVQTADLMRAILHKENGICSSGVLAHVSLLEIPGHHKLVALTDSALLTYPTIEQKVEMIRHAVALMQAIGTEVPKVAILAAVETVNPKMPETVEAAELKKMWERKEITGCIVEGPISYDLAMDPSSSRIKNYQSPVGGGRGYSDRTGHSGWKYFDKGASLFGESDQFRDDHGCQRAGSRLFPFRFN